MYGTVVWLHYVCVKMCNGVAYVGVRVKGRLRIRAEQKTRTGSNATWSVVQPKMTRVGHVLLLHFFPSTYLSPPPVTPSYLSFSFVSLPVPFFLRKASLPKKPDSDVRKRLLMHEQLRFVSKFASLPSHSHLPSLSYPSVIPCILSPVA